LAQDLAKDMSMPVNPSPPNVMTISPSPTITVLFLHHAADELTCHHYRLLRDTNREDNGVTIVPICFAEYRDQALPGSYIARNPAELRVI
jgi:hypothetical protein